MQWYLRWVCRDFLCIFTFVLICYIGSWYLSLMYFNLFYSFIIFVLKLDPSGTTKPTPWLLMLCLLAFHNICNHGIDLQNKPILIYHDEESHLREVAQRREMNASSHTFRVLQHYSAFSIILVTEFHVLSITLRLMYRQVNPVTIKTRWNEIMSCIYLNQYVVQWIPRSEHMQH